MAGARTNEGAAVHGSAEGRRERQALVPTDQGRRNEGRTGRDGGTGTRERDEGTRERGTRDEGRGPF